MPKIGYSANGFVKFCEVYEAVDAIGGLVYAVEAARGRIDGDSSSFSRRKHFLALGSSRREMLTSTGWSIWSRNIAC